MNNTYIIQLVSDHQTDIFGPYFSPQDALLAFHKSGLEMRASLPSITPLMNYQYVLRNNDADYLYVVFTELRSIRNILVDKD